MKCISSSLLRATTPPARGMGRLASHNVNDGVKVLGRILVELGKVFCPVVDDLVRPKALHNRAKAWLACLVTTPSSSADHDGCGRCMLEAAMQPFKQPLDNALTEGVLSASVLKASGSYAVMTSREAINLDKLNVAWPSSTDNKGSKQRLCELDCENANSTRSSMNQDSSPRLQLGAVQ